MKRRLLSLLLVLGLATPVAAQVIGDPQFLTATSADCSTAGSCAAFDAGSAPSIAITISGTFSETLIFEGTTDGVTWNTAQAINTATGANTTAGAVGSFAVQNSGYLKLRVRASGFVSGAARVVATRGWASARLLTPTFTTVTATTSITTPILNATTGVQINGAAGSGQFLLGNGTNFINSTLTLPNAATLGDLLTATGTNAIGSVVDVTAGSYLRSGGAGAVPVYSTTTLPNTTAAGNYLIATATNSVVAVTPALMTATPADQTGNATATFKMNGLGAAAAPCTITPVATGRVVFFISGDQVQSLTADGVTIKLAVGTIPANDTNGAAAFGTVIGSTHTWTALTGNLQTPFALQATTTGLALSTAVWFDVQIADVTGGTASLKNVTCSAHEM